MYEINFKLKKTISQQGLLFFPYHETAFHFRGKGFVYPTPKHPQLFGIHLMLDAYFLF